MSKWLFLAVLIAGAGWYWHTHGLPLGGTPKAVDAQGNPQVWVFTHPSCGDPCTDALADLRKRGQSFVEKSIDPDNREDPDSQVWRRLGNKKFPLIMVGGERFNEFSGPLLAGVLADHFGADALHGIEQHFFKEHFNADGSPRIVMYSTSWCGYCRRLRQEMVDNQVAFTEIDVEKHTSGPTLSRTLEIRGVPTTYVGYKRVVGHNLAAIKKVINP